MLGEEPLKLDQKVWAIGAAALSASLAAIGVSVSPILAAGIAAFVVLLAVIAFFDLLGLAVVLTGTLPWLVVMSEVLPRLTVTVAAGLTTLLVWQIAMPKSDGSRASSLLRLGMVLFFGTTFISLAIVGLKIGLSQAAKYVVFPLMVMAVTEATNRRDLFRLRTVALWSSAAAVTVNLFLGLTGVANIGYYGSGEVLGLASEHALALLAGCVTAAGLASSLSLAWAPVIGVGAIATVATGVRSALPGLALAGIARMITGRVRFRMMVLVGVAVAGIFVSGAAHVVEARFQKGQNLGEFQSFSAFGSGRGEIYSAAIHGWWQSAPGYWLIGTGLRSILSFEQERLGESFVGHSDIIEVGVQLGIIGLIGLILMWWTLIKRANSRLPLFVLGSFALFNGILEYSGPVVLGLLLTAGLGTRSKDTTVHQAGRERLAASPTATRGATLARGRSGC